MLRDAPALTVRHQAWEGPAALAAMSTAPDADPRLTITSRGLLRDGVGWVPVSGEIHFSRVPRSRWRERLQLMKAGGIDVVSTYLIWIHHQPESGPASFEGTLDVAGFVRLCQELGLDVVLRVGPWCHGEVRNGGFPDWVQSAPVAHRTDDPEYLALVRPWFEALGEQVASLCGPGGPVVGIQIENELYDQPEHLRTLKQMARAAGLRAPLWTATAWGGAKLPVEELFPLYSGYGDGFWVDADAPWEPTFRSHFFFSHEWDDPGVGADLRGVAAGEIETAPRDASFPPATCELGGGMATTYHRRPVPTGADIAAVANAKIGSGSAWQGYYMYAGGTNPAGDVQESQATGYPNDLPCFDYDFHAAIGAAGQLNPSHAALRRQHAFLRAFGPALVDMTSSLPEVQPSGVEDSATLRWAMRCDGTSGFVVIGWHQPHVPLPGLHGVRLELELEDRTEVIGPVGVPAGTIARWPFGLRLGGITLGWATASALTLLADATLVLVAEAGIDADVTVDPRAAVRGGCEVAPGVYRVDGEAGGLLEIELDGAHATVVIVGSRDADRVWVLDTPAGRVLALSHAPLWAEGDAIVVRSASVPRVQVYQDGWRRLRLTPGGAPLLPTRLETTCVRPAGDVPNSYGASQGRASAPDAATIADLAAHLRIADVGQESADGGHRILRVTWAGDVAQLLVGDEVVGDRFWDGTPWEIDLDVLPGAVGAAVSLRIVPLHRDSAVWLPADALDRQRSVAGALCVLDDVTLTRTMLWTGLSSTDPTLTDLTPSDLTGKEPTA